MGIQLAGVVTAPSFLPHGAGVDIAPGDTGAGHREPHIAALGKGGANAAHGVAADGDIRLYGGGVGL